MDFGHTKQENGNTTVNNVWYSSWDAAPASATTVEGYVAAGGGGGDGGQGCCHVQVDPHLTCLHLGKRQYYFNNNNNDEDGNNKRGKGGKTAPFGVVPRCQVEGCHVALVNAKEYHRRHRVCDMHSKAPKVVVLGLHQRFCQQCSRFHVVSEFDDSKRSCRRRLAGHNERRRKSSHLSVTRNSRQECALSLLSSGTASSDNWLSHHHVDLSTRCSAALHELIAENRAFLMSTRQLVNVVPHHAAIEQHSQNLQQQQPQPQFNYFPQQMFPQTH